MDQALLKYAMIRKVREAPPLEKHFQLGFRKTGENRDERPHYIVTLDIKTKENGSGVFEVCNFLHFAAKPTCN